MGLSSLRFGGGTARGEFLKDFLIPTFFRW